MRYFKRIYKEVTALSAQTGYSRFYHLWDYLTAFVRHGAHIDQYTGGGFWRYSNPMRAKCLTHYRRLALEKRYNNPDDIHYFKNKPEFNVFYRDFIRREWIWLKESTFEEFKEFLCRHSSVIVKPMDGKQGEGIWRLDYTNQGDDELRQLYDELHQNAFLIEELIDQHPDMVFGNKSVNTVRVLTACRPDGTARVMKAFMRAGVGDTLVDSTAAGGYYYEVELETGIVSSCGTSKAGDFVNVHPQSDIVVLGFKVPHWNEAMAMCLEAARRQPRVALVGWDVAISRDFVQLVEGNNSADYIGYEFVGSNGYYEKIKTFLKG